MNQELVVDGSEASLDLLVEGLHASAKCCGWLELSKLIFSQDRFEILSKAVIKNH
jgi:hypothetical protein